jgi:hypothetical protein
MGRISRTIELAKASWQVLNADKELLLLPVMSFLATLAVAASFVAPILLTGEGTTVEDPGAIGYVLMFVAYVALAYVTIFFNAALIHAANERLEGGDPTLRSALAGAARRAAAILPWAILSATVSIILRAIEERGGAFGRVAAGIAGIAWSLVTFLVLPVLVLEGIKVGDALKRSGRLFKRTWGENVAAQVGFGLLGFLAGLPAAAIIGLGINAGGSVAYGAIVVGVVWMLLVAMVITALSGIFQTALYRYAAGLEGSEAFGGGELQAAFAPRRGRGGYSG